MFAIAFDLDTNETEIHHPKSISQAYADIRSLLNKYQFDWRQGSVYISSNEDLANLFAAVNALPWFPPAVRDIRAFRVEQWSDFTPTMKS